MDRKIHYEIVVEGRLEKVALGEKMLAIDCRQEIPSCHWILFLYW